MDRVLIVEGLDMGAAAGFRSPRDPARRHGRLRNAVRLQLADEERTELHALTRKGAYRTHDEIVEAFSQGGGQLPPTGRIAWDFTTRSTSGGRG